MVHDGYMNPLSLRFLIGRRSKQGLWFWRRSEQMLWLDLDYIDPNKYLLQWMTHTAVLSPKWLKSVTLNADSFHFPSFLFRLLRGVWWLGWPLSSVVLSENSWKIPAIFFCHCPLLTVWADSTWHSALHFTFGWCVWYQTTYFQAYCTKSNNSNWFQTHQTNG